ncbi:MAG TPA: M3 family peptidase, partial [Gammaproteobacteria bacterium]|nr:M3 family peptidase [Gammaproteobacteria bacterium]
MKKLTMFLLIMALFTSTSNTAHSMNPFFTDYETPFQIPPFEEIKMEHYKPGFEQGMKENLDEINDITANTEAATFENTIVALERTGETLDKVADVFFNLLSSNTNDQMDSLVQEMSPKLSAHRDSILLNKDLFHRVKSVYEKRKSLSLNPEQTRLIEETHKYFVRAGVQLDENSMERLTEINQKLSSLSVQFEQNLLKETNEGFILVIDDKDQLHGLPKDVVDQASALAESEDHSGKWLFKPTRASMYPFLTYSTERDLREELYNSYIKRGDNNNERDNKNIAIEMSALRIERAKLLGYKTHADFVLEDNMAKNTKRVNDLLDKVWEPALSRAKQEVQEMQELIDTEGGNFKFAAWDWWHYSEKIRQNKYDFTEAEVKPYFSERKVLEGAFDVANKLFQISFTERFDLPKYRENIRSFEVKNNNGDTIGIFYTDYTIRPNKGGGAWMNTFRSQSKFDGIKIPIVINVCNFPPQNKDGVALLSFGQAETLFHEFGHALHGLLSDATYPSLSGTSVARDYVEFPSQLMENWANEPSVVQSYAQHYQTNESIPAELLKKISRASKFNQGFATTEYLAASYLDLAWHTLEEKVEDANVFEKEILQNLGLIPEIA